MPLPEGRIRSFLARFLPFLRARPGARKAELDFVPWMTPGEIGSRGEEVAAEWLEAHGFRIEERNYRCRIGELDLIGRRRGPRDLLVFVEVKTRGLRRWTTPAEAIDARKRRRMTGAARRYLQRFGARPPECRFDVIEVTPRRGKWTVGHLPDAFRPGW